MYCKNLNNFFINPIKMCYKIPNTQYLEGWEIACHLI